MIALFDQDYNKPAPDVTGEKWGTIRDLQKVWESDAVKNLSSKFGPENTLMLESDEVSVHDCFENALITDRFERNDVWPEDMSKARNQIEILTAIKEDIFKILDKCDTDIPAYLNENSKDLSSYLKKARKVTQ